MTRFWGPIGINRGVITESPGVIKQDIHEVEVSGEIRSQRLSWQNAGMRDKLNIRHVLSIVTPEDSEIDFTEVVYIVWKGRKWAVTSIEYKRPRVELSFGGLYNG